MLSVLKLELGSALRMLTGSASEWLSSDGVTGCNAGSRTSCTTVKPLWGTKASDSPTHTVPLDEVVLAEHALQVGTAADQSPLSAQVSEGVAEGSKPGLQESAATVFTSPAEPVVGLHMPLVAVRVGQVFAKTARQMSQATTTNRCK